MRSPRSEDRSAHRASKSSSCDETTLLTSPIPPQELAKALENVEVLAAEDDDHSALGEMLSKADGSAVVDADADFISAEACSPPVASKEKDDLRGDINTLAAILEADSREELGTVADTAASTLEADSRQDVDTIDKPTIAAVDPPVSANYKDSTARSAAFTNADVEGEVVYDAALATPCDSELANANAAGASIHDTASAPLSAPAESPFVPVSKADLIVDNRDHSDSEAQFEIDNTLPSTVGDGGM